MIYVGSQPSLVTGIDDGPGFGWHLWADAYRQLHVQLRAPMGQPAQMTVYTLQGVAVGQHTLPGYAASGTWQMNSLPPGQYLISLKQGNLTEVKKVMVQ